MHKIANTSVDQLRCLSKLVGHMVVLEERSAILRLNEPLRSEIKIRHVRASIT